jgi:D-alanyl-D-alanine carboxypeptidase
MLKRVLASLIAGIVVVAPAGVATAAPASALPQKASVLQEKLDAVHAAGMPGAFAEVRDGRRTWTPTTGVADVATGAPVRDGMRHRVGSITKTFVATTVLQLVGEHRIALDAPIGRYLPWVPAETGRAVTVRMLLNHTSGIGDYTSVLFQTLDDVITVGNTIYTPRQLADLGLGAPPTNAPGAAFSYSNTNYILAGLIIQKVTGHGYRTEVSRRILRPLGLRDTYFEGAEPVIRGPHMNAYVPWIDGQLRDFSRYNMTWGSSAGEIVSTAHDLNTFYRALLGGRLLTRGLLRQMQTTVVEDPDQPDAGGYGLGLYWIQLPCGKFWGHDGGTIGHQTISWHSIDGKTQMTYAQSMAYYQTSTDPHPIDVAASEFFVEALCGPQPASLRSAGVYGPHTPDVRLSR